MSTTWLPCSVYHQDYGQDHAWWQTQKKRVLLYLHPSGGETFHQVSHRASQDIGGTIHNSFAKAILKAGEPRIWFSVLTPFNEGQDASEVAARIKTNVEKDGTATATIGKLVVIISSDGVWSVKR